MPPFDRAGQDARGARRHPRWSARVRHLFLNTRPSRLLALGYLSYMVLGWALLTLPLAQAQPVGALDNLFIAASAVSTTGLVTVDPGSSYTVFGEAVILILIQLGGLGYMTVGSFAYLSFQNRLNVLRSRTVRTGFGLPATMDLRQFLRAVVLFTLSVEATGALALWPLFAAAGVEGALWQAVFHAVSSFCTAGFSLFATSLEAFRGDPGVVGVVSLLSLLGAMGFLIVVDLVHRVMGEERKVGFSARVILATTAVIVAAGTLVLGLAEPTIAALPGGERWLAAFFQAMTASTTVGFNTVPIAPVSGAAVLAILLMMVVGASPAGTGGGLKTTTFAVLWAGMKSVFRGRAHAGLLGRTLPDDRLRVAGAALSGYLGLMVLGLFLLLLCEPGARFDVLWFEAVSALSTVGLSMGITGSLSEAGKWVVIGLMFAGRVGILTFGIAFALSRAPEPEPAEGDVVL